MIIQYVNSKNESVNLNQNHYKLLISDIINYEWDTVEKNGKISGFKKGIQKKNVNIDVLKDKKFSSRELLNKLTDVFETDIYSLIPGRLYIDDYYIKCYVYSSERENWETDAIVSCECSIATDHPFWIREHEYIFKAQDADHTEGKKYAYRYAYRYANGLMNTAIINEHYMDCNFKMVIYGPITDPLIYIGGHPYLVNIILEVGEYLEIDSAAETVVKVTAFGKRINAFHNRSFTDSVFEPVHPGQQLIGWSGRFDFDITLYEERSEPKWASKAVI